MNACANDILRANLIDLPSRSAPKVSYARLILVILICICPFILLLDGAIMHGLVAGLAAVGIGVLALSIRPGETQFLISVIRPGAALAVVPALWVIFQTLPLRVIAHPIWASAEAALGHPAARLDQHRLRRDRHGTWPISLCCRRRALVCGGGGGSPKNSMDLIHADGRHRLDCGHPAVS